MINEHQNINTLNNLKCLKKSDVKKWTLYLDSKLPRNTPSKDIKISQITRNAFIEQKHQIAAIIEDMKLAGITQTDIQDKKIFRAKV